MLKEAKRRGASDAVAEVSEGQGLSVTVRKGEVETIEQSLDKQVGVTVFWGIAAAMPALVIFLRHHLRQLLKLRITLLSIRLKMIAQVQQKRSC